MALFTMVFLLFAAYAVFFLLLGLNGRRVRWQRPHAPNSSAKDDARSTLDDIDDGDYYVILQLPQNASLAEIKAAYHRLSRIHHPDKNLDDKDAADRRFVKVKAAYEILSNEATRAEYDQERSWKRESESPEPLPFKPRAHRSAMAAEFFDLYGLHVSEIREFKMFIEADTKGFTSPKWFKKCADIFQLIVDDECGLSHRTPTTFPSFGYRDTVYRREKRRRGPQDSDVKAFYEFWSSFSSKKVFNWAVPPGLTKRLEPKLYKACVIQAKQEHSDAVKDLVKAVQERDPRVPRKA